jgi:hypothetical protein
MSLTDRGGCRSYCVISESNTPKTCGLETCKYSTSFYRFPKYTNPTPIIINTNPRRRRFSSGISRTFRIQSFIFAGKAKYGTPSKIMTMPTTHRKNSIQFTSSAGAPSIDPKQSPSRASLYVLTLWLSKLKAVACNRPSASQGNRRFATNGYLGGTGKLQRFGGAGRRCHPCGCEAALTITQRP